MTAKAPRIPKPRPEPTAEQRLMYTRPADVTPRMVALAILEEHSTAKRHGYTRTLVLTGRLAEMAAGFLMAAAPCPIDPADQQL